MKNMWFDFKLIPNTKCPKCNAGKEVIEFKNNIKCKCRSCGYYYNKEEAKQNRQKQLWIEKLQKKLIEVKEG